MFLLFISNPIFSQSTYLDSTFSVDGKNTVSFTEFEDICYEMLVQPDGKILMIGYADYGASQNERDFALVRFLPNGELDDSFGNGGKVLTDFDQSHDSGYDAVLQDDGKIIVVGVAETGGPSFPDDIAICRYLENGDLDSSFGVDGKVLEDLDGKNDIANGIVLLDDGKFLVTGLRMYQNNNEVDGFIARYNSDGTRDLTFNQTGIKNYNVYSNAPCYGEHIVVQPDGKIVVSGYTAAINPSQLRNIYVRRFDEDGNADFSFNQVGFQVFDFFEKDDYVRDLVLQPDGKILIGGFTLTSFNPTNFDFIVVRLNPDGTFDNSFSDDGTASYDFFGRIDVNNSMLVQEDGKILLAGQTQTEEEDFISTVARINPDGTRDETFGANGQIFNNFFVGNTSTSESATSILFQPDNKIVLGGIARDDSGDNSDFTILRYLPDFTVGIVEFSLESAAINVYPNPIESELTLDYDLSEEEILSIDLIDVNGKIIQTVVDREKRVKGNHQEKISLNPSLTAGNYFLILDNGVGKFQVKLTKI